MSSRLDSNLAAMTSLSAEATQAVAAAARGDGIAIRLAGSGEPVLEWHGRALDSRRDPRAAAESAAAAVNHSPVALIGFGSGYLAEALVARGITVAAVVERAGVLAGALAARDFTRLLASVPVFALEQLAAPGVLPRLRAMASRVVVHAPSVAATPELGALADRWNDLRPARTPRVLVVGPTAGGSLGIADSAERAARRLGCDVHRFDARPFAPAQSAFGTMAIAPDARVELQGRLMLLAGEAVVHVASQWRADVVLAIAQAPLTAPSLDALRAQGIPSVFWFVENTRVLPYWRDVAGHYDHFYAIQPGSVLDRIRDAGATRVGYLPVACDPELHAPVALTDDERARYGSPVSFAGAPYLNRRHLLEAVRDLGLTVWGEGWESTAFAPCLRETGRFDVATMRRVCAGTLVNLNIHSAEHVAGLDPLPDYVNPRTFELAACGAFQLVDRRDPLGDLFTADEVVTFSTAAEMRRLARHYLEHRDEAAGISSRARARVLADHTYDRRLATILADVLPPHLQPGIGIKSLTLDDALASASAAGQLEAEEIHLRVLADVRDTLAAR